MKGILLSKFQHDNGLELLAGKGGLDRQLTVDEISRPGLEFTGFFDFFDNKRIVLIGSKDAAFLGTLPNDVRKKNVEKLFSLNPPCMVFSKNVNIDDLFYEMAEKYNIPLFKTKLTTNTSFRVNNKRKEILTLAGNALLVFDMVNVFLTELSDCRKSWVWSRLSKSTQRA